MLHTSTVKRTDFLLIGQATIMDKSLGALLHFWGVFQFTQVEPLPSPHKQRWTRISRIFSEFQLCIGWGRENCKKKKIKKERAVLWGNPWKWQKNMNIALNVPRTFVHDCLKLGKEKNLWHPKQGCGKESYKQRKGDFWRLTLLNWTWTVTMLACAQTLYFLF